MDLEKERKEILMQSAEARARDVLLHQINIDNCRGALAEISEHHSDTPEMAAFRDQLQALLESSLVEQTKEQIMLTVIQRQLEVER